MKISYVYKTLLNVRLYGISDSIGCFDLQRRKHNLKKMFWYNWEYFAYKSPIWKKRFDMCDIEVDNENLKIVFNNEIFSDEISQIFINNFDNILKLTSTSGDSSITIDTYPPSTFRYNNNSSNFKDLTDIFDDSNILNLQFDNFQQFLNMRSLYKEINDVDLQNDFNEGKQNMVNVNYIIDSELAVTGQNVTAIFEFIDAQNSKKLWTETYEENIESIFILLPT